MILILPVSAQRVGEISEMKVEIFVAEKAHFKYELTLKNLVNNPVVFGDSEIRLQKVEPVKFLIPIPFTERTSAVVVENLRAYSENMNFQTEFENAGDYSVIHYRVWYPVEPQGTMKVIIEFDADIVDKGLIFKSITVPVGGDFDIKNVEILVNSDWHLCYFEEGARKVPAGSITFYTAEFSALPLPMLPVRGYVLFWGIVIAAIVILGFFSLRRK